MCSTKFREKLVAIFKIFSTQALLVGSPQGFNLLKPNDIYICRTTALTSRRYILYIYSTNKHTEYFKHAA